MRPFCVAIDCQRSAFASSVPEARANFQTELHQVPHRGCQGGCKSALVQTLHALPSHSGMFHPRPMSPNSTSPNSRGEQGRPLWAAWRAHGERGGGTICALCVASSAHARFVPQVQRNVPKDVPIYLYLFLLVLSSIDTQGTGKNNDALSPPRALVFWLQQGRISQHEGG